MTKHHPEEIESKDDESVQSIKKRFRENSPESPPNKKKVSSVKLKETNSKLLEDTKTLGEEINKVAIHVTAVKKDTETLGEKINKVAIKIEAVEEEINKHTKSIEEVREEMNNLRKLVERIRYGTAAQPDPTK